MRLVYAVAMIALLSGRAYAEEHMKGYGEPDPEKTAQEKAADKAADKAYNNSLGNIPDRGPVDPWGAARATDTPKPAAKAAPKVVTGNSSKPKPKPVVTPN